MTAMLVSGLINLETTVKIGGFPLAYNPVNYPFFGVNSTVSGVGYNLAKALTTLGHEVNFCSLIGADNLGKLALDELTALGISTAHILPQLGHTSQSCILYDPQGRRQIHVDLKDIQEQTYPIEPFRAALVGCEVAVLCNINFSRPFLQEALQAGKLIATDVHAISQLEDDYNRDFMTYAHILFMSHEQLPTTPEHWATEVIKRYGAEVVVIGLGSEGALLAVRQDNFMERLPAVTVRPIVNTVGAGDALFAAFLHGYVQNRDPYHALQQALLFAGYKIGAAGAADGFLTAGELQNLAEK